MEYKSRSEILTSRETNDPMDECRRLRRELMQTWDLLQTLRAQNRMLVTDQLVDARRILFDVFAQSTWVGDKYNHGYLSAYEEAQNYLLAIGMLHPEDCDYA